MKYKLMQGYGKGILIDRVPIMRDIRDTFEVSFLLPSSNAFVALFRGEDGIEHKAVIKNGRVKIPPALLAKEQYAGLIVTEINNETVIRSWECEPLKITAYFHLRQDQWQVSGGMTEKDAFTRLTEIEKQFAETQTLIMTDKRKNKKSGDDLWLEFNKLQGQFDKYKAAIRKGSLKLIKDNKELAKAYNKSIEVINGLSQRVAALEKNYDPTIID